MKIIEKKIPVSRSGQGSSIEEIYDNVMKTKSAKEKIRLADGLFEYAKKVNPRAFQWPKS